MIDNRPGASGIIGTEVVARAAPDGYTLLMVFPSHPVNPTLKKQLPYDTIRDFIGVTTLTTVSLVLLVPPSLRRRTVQELIALAKKRAADLRHRSAAAAWHISAPSCSASRPASRSRTCRIAARPRRSRR